LIFTLTGAITAICFVVSDDQGINLVYAQQNTANTIESSQNITDILPYRGINSILYTKQGAQQGLNEIYTYEIGTKKITYANTMNEVKQKVLDQAQIDALNDILYDPGISEVYDRKLCPDCIQYGLTFTFVEWEILLKSASFSYWTDITKKSSTEGLNKLASMIEELVKK
jgi:hypothetical protein